MSQPKKRYLLLSDWLRILQRASREGGKVFSLESLRRVSGLSGASLRKALSRLRKKGVITHVGPRLYMNPFSPASLEELAMVLGHPCYISFESALSRYGILSQSPQVLTCATRRKPKGISTPLGEIVLRHISPRLFGGYREENGILWAEPEKALLDWLYWKSKVEGPLADLKELNLEETDSGRLRTWVERFPSSIKRLLKMIGMI